MPSANGRSADPETVILYTRVSGDEQAKKGYSLRDQLAALREWAGREGYEVVEEATDDGYSGAYLERPGLDRVRELVEAGSISVVVALFRDRIARGIYVQLLQQEFAERGTRLIALNAQLDDTPEGELQGGILDQFAAFERAKIQERTRRGKLRKAREGKVLANNSVDYGFGYNDARDGYVVDEEAMAVVRRIFRMVGVEGAGIRTVENQLNREGVRPPGSAWSRSKRWGATTIREEIISDDVYRPHTYEEIAKLVTPEVSARLDQSKLYGIWWYNRTKEKVRQVPFVGENGVRGYKKRRKTVPRPREEWIAVPVPDAGIPREWVDAAREAIKNNRKASNAGRRLWELSGGVARCGLCGHTMVCHTATSKHNKAGRTYTYFYYVCQARERRSNKATCGKPKLFPAAKLEEQVWHTISTLMQHPEELREGLDAMIEEKRKELRGDPDREIERWLDKMGEVEQERRGYLRLAARGHMSDEELDGALGKLDQARRTTERELAALKGSKEQIEQMERDAEAVMEGYAGVTPDALEALTPEERNRLYRTLRLQVRVHHDGHIEISGPFKMDNVALDILGSCDENRVTRSGATPATSRAPGSPSAPASGSKGSSATTRWTRAAFGETPSSTP